MAVLRLTYEEPFFLTDDLGNAREPHAGFSLFFAVLVAPFLVVPCVVVVGAAVHAARRGQSSCFLVGCAWLACTLALFGGVTFVARRDVTVKCFACTHPELGGGSCTRETGPDLTSRVPGELGAVCPDELVREVADDTQHAAAVGAGIAIVGVIGAAATASLRRRTPAGRTVAAVVAVLATSSLLVLTYVATDARVTSEFRPDPAPVPLGQTLVGTDGRSVTVSALDPNLGPPGLESAVVGVDAEVCAGTQELWVGAHDFRLSTDGIPGEVTGTANSVVPPVQRGFPGGSTIVLPRNPVGTRVFPDGAKLAPGECVRGWVDFIPATPPTERAVVRYPSNGTDDDLLWRWP